MRLGSQAHPQLLDVIGGLGVLEDQVLIAHFAHRHATDLVLVGLADHRVGGAPQVGQVRDAVRLAAAAAPPEAAAGQIPPIVFVRRNAGENAGSDLWLYDAATMQTRPRWS